MRIGNSAFSGLIAPTSSPETILVVPSQYGPLRLMCGFPRHMDGAPMQRIVIPPVFELLLDAVADLEVQVGRDGHVTGVEQAMDVAPQ